MKTMDFFCYADKNYEIKVRAEGSMNCVYWYANGDWITDFLQKLTVAQQAQILLGDDIDSSGAQKKPKKESQEEEVQSPRESPEELKNIEGVLAEYMNQQLSLEQSLQEKEEELQNLRRQVESLAAENSKVEEERDLLLKQKEAFLEGKEETELNLVKLTEELTAEKRAISDQFEASRMHFDKQNQQLENALDQETKKMENIEKDHNAVLEDLYNQIDALQKQLSSNSRFSEEQTNEREQERDQYENEIAKLREELEKRQDLRRSDSKLAQEVVRLEEELEARDQAHQEEVAKMQEEENKMKQTIQEYEENLQELREKESVQSELEKARADLQDITREREVLQQELYDNLIKVSALEAKLDQYKHYAEMSGANGGAGDHSQVERLKMNLDQEREALASKDNEIEHLVGVQMELRSEIVDKEAEVERLLLENERMNDLEAENAEFKEKLRILEEEQIRGPSSRAEELSALSRQLLDDKNAEIDDLMKRIQMLENQSEEAGGSLSFEQEDQDSIVQHLQEENEELKRKLKETVEKLESKSVLQKLELEVSGQEEDLEASDDAQAKDEAMQDALDSLQKENEALKEEVNQLQQEKDERNTAGASEDPLPPQIKEKIRHLEELLEKEKDAQQKKEGSDLVSENPESKEDEEDIIQDKLLEIENDLKSQPSSILGKILSYKDSILQQTEKEMAYQKENIDKLQKEVSNLEQTLSEPDVKIRMKRKQKHPAEKDEDREIDVEKDGSSSSEADEQSSVTSDENSHMTEDEDPATSTQEPEKEADLSFDELKILLDQQEKDLQIKDELIEQQEKILTEKEKECTEANGQLQEMIEKCEELQNELDQRLEETQKGELSTPSFSGLSEEDILHIPIVQATLAQATQELQESLSKAKTENISSKEEKDRLMSDLSDIQREYMALLGENRGIQEMQETHKSLQDKILELENLAEQRESELHQAKQETEDAQIQIQELSQTLQQQALEVDKQEEDKDVEEIEGRILELEDEMQVKMEMIEELERKLEDSLKTSEAYKEEIDLLQNEQQILSSDNERFQQQTEELKLKVDELESAFSEKQMEFEQKEQELQEILNRERFLEPISSAFERGSFENENLQKSLDPELVKDESNEDLMKIHQEDMDKLKEDYSREITRAVEETRQQLKEEYDNEIHDMEHKHRREVADLLSESYPGESELARKLREELDQADQLDQNLIGHLASTPVGSPDTDISSKLQRLMEKLHKEGVQVLTLSELQFIKHHRQNYPTSPQATSPLPITVEEAQQTSLRLEEDMINLRHSWESEKLALLNAIQALKELVSQTNADDAQENLPESDDWRGDLLRAVSDVFDREREVLLAELQTTVTEAQQALDAGGSRDPMAYSSAMDKLAAMEKKLKEQSTQHTSALEKLLSVDRNSLLAEIEDLRIDREHTLAEAKERVKHLENSLSNNENANSQNVQILQSQIERLEYKLQQERALAADIQASLEAERVRSSEYLPALQKERDRTERLDNEISRLQKKLTEDTETSRARTESLQNEMDERRQHLEELQSKLSESQRKLKESEDLLKAEKRNGERMRLENNNVVQDLKRAVMSEENRREGLTRSLEGERANVARLHEELATLRADSHQEVAEQKIKVADLEANLEVEKRRCDDANLALKREQETSERLQQTLDEERESNKDARQNDRATIADLQKILDDARRETDKLQKKMEISARDLKLAKQQLDDVQAVHSDALEAERAVKDQLQSAFESVQVQKKEAQKKLNQLEDELRRQQMSNLVTSAGVPGSSETQEGLLTNRRQLESLRQRLQLETSKLQDLTSKTAHRLPVTLPPDSLNYPQDAARVLASEIEQVDTVKRSLGEMQQELREMYSTLSMPKRDRSGVLLEPSNFNDRLLEQNAELVMLNTRHADEKINLRDGLRRLEEELWKARADTQDQKSEEDVKQHQQQVQDMATRMHRLYTKYLRAESFRKALVYQKKYLLLLIGGFQDCEEATLALIARMGAYPSRESFDCVVHRSPAFKKFRSAVRAVMAMSRMKFLVRKWQRTNKSVSQSIQEKHGTAPIVNGHHHHPRPRPSPSASPNLLRPTSSVSAHTLGEKSPSPTPLPRRRQEGLDNALYDPYKPAAWASAQHSDTTPTKLGKPPLGPSVPSSYALSSSRRRSTDSYTPTYPTYGDPTSSTAMRYLNGTHRSPARPRPHSSFYPDSRTADLSSYNRSQQNASDPSYDYIQKLENLHQRLEQNPHRFRR